MKEYDNGVKHKKSALQNFIDNYVIDGKPGLTPIQFFVEKVSQIKEFMRNHQNIKVRMIMVCNMEKKEHRERKIILHETKVYFNSKTYDNLESTDVKSILSQMIDEILYKITDFQENGSDWYFKEIVRLEIHIVVYKPYKGSSDIPLPEFIMRKKR